VEILAPGRTLAMRIPELNEALLFIELEPGAKDVSCGIWLSTYDLDSATSYRAGIDAWMEKLAVN